MTTWSNFQKSFSHSPKQIAESLFILLRKCTSKNLDLIGYLGISLMISWVGMCDLGRWKKLGAGIPLTVLMCFRNDFIVWRQFETKIITIWTVLLYFSGLQGFRTQISWSTWNTIAILNIIVIRERKALKYNGDILYSTVYGRLLPCSLGFHGWQPLKKAIEPLIDPNITKIDFDRASLSQQKRVQIYVSLDDRIWQRTVRFV